MDADHRLDLAALLLAILLDHAEARRVDLNHRHARSLGQAQGLENLGLRVIRAEEAGDVHQVAAVGPPADEVAAQDQAADLQAANLAAGKRLALVSGGCGRGGGGRLLVTRGAGYGGAAVERGAQNLLLQAQERSRACGSREGRVDEVPSVSPCRHGKKLPSCGLSNNKKSPVQRQPRDRAIWTVFPHPFARRGIYGLSIHQSIRNVNGLLKARNGRSLRWQARSRDFWNETEWSITLEAVKAVTLTSDARLRTRAGLSPIPLRSLSGHYDLAARSETRTRCRAVRSGGGYPGSGSRAR